jgi:hypothetical protein
MREILSWLVVVVEVTLKYGVVCCIEAVETDGAKPKFMYSNI